MPDFLNMKRYFAIILLLGVFAANMDIICQRVLCMAGHNVTTGGHLHLHHVRTNHSAKSSPALYLMDEPDASRETPEDGMHQAMHNYAHQSHHNNRHQASTNYYCPVDKIDQLASVDFEFTLTGYALDLKPYLQIISKIKPGKTIFSSSEPLPLEYPPNMCVRLEESVLKA